MTLLTYLKLNTSDLEAGVAKSKKELADLNAAASAAGGAASSKPAAPGKDPADALKKVKPAAGTAVQGLNAVSAANGLMSGTTTGAASGAIALTSALKGLGVASATSIGAIAAFVAALAMIGKHILDARREAARMQDVIKLDNAQSGVESLRKGFERLVETMDGAVGLMRELRALSREGMDIDADKRIAQIELDRKRELAALDPGDAKGAQAVNTRFDRLRTGAELDREEAANAAAAAEQRRQREENAAAIAERRAQAEQMEAAAKDAAAKRKTLLTSEPESWKYLPFMGGKDQEREMEADAAKWGGVAQTAADEASRIRKEIEELERKNQVLEEQARIYEKRNEVVAIKREAAGIEAPVAGEEEKEQKKSGGISGALNVPTDRLTRIGGVTAGGFGAASGGGVAEKQFNETRRMREILERIARKEPGAVLG